MKVFALFGMLLGLASLNAQEHLLTIQFKGVESREGQLMVAITNEKGQTLVSQSLKPKPGENILNIDLPPGRYAIKAFHDLDGNGKLNKNLVGIPQEPYGFSGKKHKLGLPPAMEDQLIDLYRDERVIITLR